MARLASIPNSSGLVQIVRLQWEKSARGGQGARVRNAVPHAFAIPTTEVIDNGGQLGIDVLEWSERNAFVEPLSVSRRRVAISDGFTYGCVHISPHPEGLQVHYQYDMANGGAPDRSYLNYVSGEGKLPGRILLVRPEQWVRVCYNGRFTYFHDGNWYYVQTSINVAWFAGETDGRVFLDREPCQELQVLADLW